MAQPKNDWDHSSVFADIIAHDPAPFVQAIFDYGAPIIARGRVVLLGDAAFVVRPHTAMGVKAAGDGQALRDALEHAGTVEEAIELYNKVQHTAGVSIASDGRRLRAGLAVDP